MGVRRFVHAFRLAVGFASLTAGAQAQLTDVERRGLEDALFLGNLKVSDLNFPRQATADAFRPPLVGIAIEQPLEGAERMMALHAGARAAKPSDQLAQALRLLTPMLTSDLTTAPTPPPADLPPALAAVVADLAATVSAASASIRTALKELPPAEQRRLLESLAVWAVEEPKVKFSFVRQPAMSQREILASLSKVDLPRVWRAGLAVSVETDRAVASLRRMNLKWSGRAKLTVAGMPTVVAGIGSDVHEDTDARLTIDLGGDDVYRGRHGAGVGYASVLIDLGGNDRYEVGDLNVGAGLLGAGIAYDGGGDDRMLGGSLTFGAGLAGVGTFTKVGGAVRCDAIALTQGFGQLGAGVYIDAGGDDVYRASLFAQGAARTQGVGWLIDRGGDDTYRAGGLSSAAPLLPTATYSFGQGFASGYRDDAGGLSGGIGLLTDFAGADAYVGEAYSQGASYWYALGSLYDASGHDTYSAYYYSQASAMHLCAASLFDLQGDDAYVVKLGACHAIGHDYGVAVLLDRDGTDTYAAKDSTPGIGTANGVGVFLDAAGEDRYHGPPGRGNAARGSGSLGVFADLGGQDLYRADLTDGSAAVRDTWGVAYDQEDPLRTRDPAEPDQKPKPVPGSKPLPSLVQLEQVYRKATQWRVGSATAEVEQNLDLLVEYGMPAFDWMIDNKLPTADRLQARAFSAVVVALGTPAREKIALRVLSENENEARMALRVCEEANVQEAGAVVVNALRRPALRTQAIRVAGMVKATVAVGELMPICASPNPTEALSAMVALSQIGDEGAYTTAEALLSSPYVGIKKAALALCSRFPDKALATGRRLIGQDDESNARTGVELLGLIGTPEALKDLGDRLLDPRPGVRISAMVALNGRVPLEVRPFLQSLRLDPIPTVRAVAARIDPGR